MNERQLFRALGDVDDSLLEAAERLPHRKSPVTPAFGSPPASAWRPSLAAPYVALFTKGASSADPKAAVSTQGAPSATEAAPRASSDRNGSIQEFAPETQATAPHTQVNTASTAPSQSYSPCPDDFSFSLAWEGNAYDSATGLLTCSDGETIPYLSVKSSASVPGPCCPVWNSQRAGGRAVHFPHRLWPDRLHEPQPGGGGASPNHFRGTHPPDLPGGNRRPERTYKKGAM